MARSNRPVSRRQSWWLLATALAAFLPLTPQLPGWLIASAGAAFAWRGLISWRGWRLPSRWLLVILVFAGMAGVIYQYRSILGRTPGVALLGIFLALKLLELKAARDAMATVLLCYFLVLANFLFTQTIPTAVVAILTVVVATATLMAAQDDRPSPLALLRRSGLLLAQALPFMLLLFILFPRVDGPLWGIPQDRFSAVSGLSDTMSPGSIAQLSQSDAVAFRVRFTGGAEAAPPQGQLYWRGPVMPAFDGRSWRVAQTHPQYRTLPYVEAGDPVDYELTLEPHGKQWLFALEMPGSLPKDAALTADYQPVARQPVRNRIRYEQRAWPQARVGLNESPRQLSDALALPADGNPRIRAVAAEWRTRHGLDDAAILAAAEDFFLRQLLVYTLEPPLLGRDSVDEFLFETRRGFCEHFASAFAFSLRAAGVPARVVAGYQGGEMNPVDGYLVVRQYDAHAWTEVWLRDRGWVRVDPTAISAPRRINANLASAVPAGDPLPLLARSDLAWLKDLRQRLDAVTNGWNQWVLGYSQQRQRDFLQSLGLGEADWRRMTAVLAVLCGLVLLALTAWVLRHRRRVDPAFALWHRFTRRLARRGPAWRAWEGPRDYAERAAAALPDKASAIREIAALYGRLRYGPKAGEAELQRLKTLIAAFRP